MNSLPREGHHQWRNITGDTQFAGTLMVIRDLTREQCEALLARTSLGRLACVRDGQPYIVPILFSFDPSTRHLYCFSTVGQKSSGCERTRGSASKWTRSWTSITG